MATGSTGLLRKSGLLKTGSGKFLRQLSPADKQPPAPNRKPDDTNVLSGFFLFTLLPLPFFLLFHPTHLSDYQQPMDHMQKALAVNHTLLQGRS